MNYSALWNMMTLHCDKLIPRHSISETLSRLHDASDTIAFTNGCFDVLHAGHIYYLQRAKSHGSVLWIGLNSDISVKSIKGPNRPIHSQDARAFVLNGLACVDFITIFDEDTPIDLLSQIKPDRHIKGGDYTKDSLPEYPIVKAYGGDVIIEPFLEGFSSTNIINKGLE